MYLSDLNALPLEQATELFMQCCSASNWVGQMVGNRPYPTIEAMMSNAELAWAAMEQSDFREAFDGHPKIGDPDSLKEKYRSTHTMAAGEQSGMAAATEQTIKQLALANQSYVEKFGFIFIVCATGKSAEEMLRSIEQRLENTPDQEIQIAAAEQMKITNIRLSKIVKA